MTNNLLFTFQLIEAVPELKVTANLSYFMAIKTKQNDETNLLSITTYFSDGYLDLVFVFLMEYK